MPSTVPFPCVFMTCSPPPRFPTITYTASCLHVCYYVPHPSIISVFDHTHMSTRSLHVILQRVLAEVFPQYFEIHILRIPRRIKNHYIIVSPPAVVDTHPPPVMRSLGSLAVVDAPFSSLRAAGPETSDRKHVCHFPRPILLYSRCPAM